MTLWLLGYPDRALRICAEACRYADASQHPFSQAIARTISLRVHQFRGMLRSLQSTLTPPSHSVKRMDLCTISLGPHFARMGDGQPGRV